MMKQGTQHGADAALDFLCVDRVLLLLDAWLIG
jgi:hypothetical protein